MSEIISPRRGPGRPKGSKNQKTLLREELIKLHLKQSQDLMVCELPKIVKALVRKAKEGDVQAAKVLLDRCIPSRKAVEHLGTPVNNQKWEFNVHVVDPRQEREAIEGTILKEIPEDVGY